MRSGLALCLAVLTALALATSAAATPVVSTDWMVSSGYGLSVHWTSQSLPSSGGSPAAFCDAVDDFDVDAYAQQVVDSGAGYVIFPLGHAQMYLPMPNATLASVLPGRTCSRDLPADLYDALAPKGVKLVFYYPNIATPDDPDWVDASQWNSDRAAFAQLQYDIVAEIGNRYGSKLAGWWVDNTMGGYTPFYDYSTYATALRAGNANRAIAFNYSSINAWPPGSSTGAGIEDFAGGESNDLVRLPSGRYSGEGGTQWHTWSWLDDFWLHDHAGTPTPRYSDNKVILYAKSVLQGQGVLSLNAAPFQDTLISDPTMDQLRALKAAVRDAPGSTRVVDDRDPGIAYSGAWGQVGREPYHLETGTFSRTGGDSATFSFTGRTVRWYGPKGPDHGKANVCVDALPCQVVDLYSPSRADVALIASITGLTPTSHTLQIVVRSDRNPASSDTFVEVDALEYQTGTRVDDGDGSISYSGGWFSSTIPSLYGATAHATDTAGATATHTFTGDSITWYGVRGPDHGKANVCVDALPCQVVDLYQTAWSGATPVFSLSGLGAGGHTIEIEARSDRSAAATDNFVEVDAFESP